MEKAEVFFRRNTFFKIATVVSSDWKLKEKTEVVGDKRISLPPNVFNEKKENNVRQTQLCLEKF